MDILFYPRINDALDAAGRCSLYCVITINQHRCVPFSTKIRVVAKNWQTKKKTTKDEFSDTIRQELNRIENTLRRIKIDLEEQNKPITAHIIKHTYLGLKKQQTQRKDKNDEKDTTLATIFNHITENKMRKGAKDSTRRHDRYLGKLFIDFAKSKGFKDIKPIEVDLALVENFIENFNKSSNYLNQSVRFLKTALNYALKKKIIDTNPVVAIELLTVKKNTTEQGLELSELEKFKAAQTLTEKEEIAKDIFLFMCGTSIDFCDYNNLSEFDIEELGKKKILRNKRQKTDRYNAARICNQNTIIKDCALEVIEKYGGLDKLPRVKHINLLNNELQKIAKREGIELWITTKRARKTFANISINYELHTDEQTAYQMGHTTTNQLKSYRRYSDKILDNLIN